MNQNLLTSLLADIDGLALKPSATVQNWGRTLIVAPHPDDESLGCGGAIALLRQFDCRVDVLVMSDGTLSHPGSRKYPAPALRQLREKEMLDALAILNVDAANVTFLAYKDRSVPNIGDRNFEAARAVCRDYLLKNAAQTILVPWRRDPHPDHLASHALIAAAARELPQKPKIIEYPIWLWELAQSADAPQINEGVTAWRLDIAAVVGQKQAAIMAHRSQTTDLIDDDPNGFRLTPEILANFAVPWEVYLENV